MRTMHVTTAIFMAAAMIASVPASGLAAQKRTTSPVGPHSVQPGVAYAGTTVECGNKSYYVTTGTPSGKCEDIYAPNKITIVGKVCKDSKGNYAGATCGGGCLNSTGAGDCKKPQ